MPGRKMKLYCISLKSGMRTVTGVKKSLVLEPGTSKISIRTSKNFHPMSDGQVKKYSGRLYFLESPALFGNRTSKNLDVLVRRTSGHFKKFLPLSQHKITLKMLKQLVLNKHDNRSIVVSLLKLLGLTSSCHYMYIYSSGGATTPYSNHTIL